MINSLKLKHPLQMLCNQRNVAVRGLFCLLQWQTRLRTQTSRPVLAHAHRVAHARGRGIYGAHKLPVAPNLPNRQFNQSARTKCRSPILLTFQQIKIGYTSQQSRI